MPVDSSGLLLSENIRVFKVNDDLANQFEDNSLSACDNFKTNLNRLLY